MCLFFCVVLFSLFRQDARLDLYAVYAEGAKDPERDETVVEMWQVLARRRGMDLSADKLAQWVRIVLS
jgi:hypothetical protein